MPNQTKQPAPNADMFVAFCKAVGISPDDIAQLAHEPAVEEQRITKKSVAKRRAYAENP